jgi:hypothetical protein
MELTVCGVGNVRTENVRFAACVEVANLLGIRQGRIAFDPVTYVVTVSLQLCARACCNCSLEKGLLSLMLAFSFFSLGISA